MLPDEALMKQYQEGNAQAFDSLYSRHAGRVMGFLLQRLASRARAEEVLQAAFLKLHRSRHQFDPSQPFAPWFFRLVQNVLNDALRVEKRNPVQPTREDATPTLEGIPDRKGEESPPLAAALLERLDDPQRQLLELRYLKGLSFDVIASRLGITTDSARQRVSRAIRRLRALSAGGRP
jgi:RNA polymerase sigma factor (sigma-70 family)